MQKSERIVRYTDEELDEMIRRGEDKTNWERLDALTDEEIEASIDYEEEGVPDMSVVYVGIPHMQHLTVYVDADILDYFKSGGPGHQTRINAVLRSYVESQQKKAS